MTMATVLDFCRGLPEQTFGSGAELIGEGTAPDVLYVLIEGTVEVLKGDVEVNTVSEPGAIFGEVSVLLDMPHMATVKALTMTRVHVIAGAAEFLRSNTEIAYLTARLLAQRLYGLTTYLVDLKDQFQEREGHLGMVDEVLQSLSHQQSECTPGSERHPDTTI